NYQAQPLDLYGDDWASSFYGLLLKWLEPAKVKAVIPKGIPSNELAYLTTGQKLPDLLLWGDLLAQISARELATAMPIRAVISANANAVDLTSTTTLGSSCMLIDGVFRNTCN